MVKLRLANIGDMWYNKRPSSSSGGAMRGSPRPHGVGTWAYPKSSKAYCCKQALLISFNHVMTIINIISQFNPTNKV